MCSSVTARHVRGAPLRLAILHLACTPAMAGARVADRDEEPRVPAAPSLSRNDDVEFDENMLKLRGIDPRLAAYFREAPRFTAGRHVVSLSVNGRAMGHADARFNERGAVCVDKDLLDAAEVDLAEARDRIADIGGASPCVDLRSIYPTSSINVDPGKAAVSFLVPTEALRASRQDLSAYARGGAAALFNYEIVGLDSRGRSGGSRYASANTELGFNAGDWMVRSRQVSTVSDGRRRSDVLDTYAQRSLADYRAVLQAGELNLTNPVLSGAQITGIQIMSEQALALQASGGLVEGIAPSPARVEVRQNDVLVYSTVVPAGPFSLNQIPRISRSADMDVTVTGEDGSSRHFVVTAAMAGPMVPLAGYSFAVGRTRNAGGETPWVISGGWSGTIGPSASLSGGAMVASNYLAIGGGVVAQARTSTQVQLNVTAAQAGRDKASGVQASLTLSQPLSERWSFAASQTRQSPGFRNLLDTTLGKETVSRRPRYRDQSSASLSWSHPDAGNLSAGYSRTMLFDGRATSRALASWGTRIGRASVSLSAEWTLGGTRRVRDNSIYLNVSLPLGDRRRLSSSARRYDGGTRYGVNLSEQVNEYASYRAGLEYQSSDRRRSLTAGVSLLPRYFQLDSSYARNPASSSYSLGVRGALVLHPHGVTASPYAVRDTFGVLVVDDTAGVRVSTPAGPVWTDARGYAVLAQLTPFGKNRIEVATDSLPRHLDIHNGAAVIQSWRGAVTSLHFAVSKTRRLLLSARTVDGSDLPAGASVTDEDGELVSLVQGNGQIFVANALTSSRLWVTAPDLPRCELVYKLPESSDPDAYYESAVAICRGPASTVP